MKFFKINIPKMVILKEQEHKRLLNIERQMIRFGQISWLHDYPWLTVPLKEHVYCNGSGDIVATREEIRQNYLKQLNTNQKSIDDMVLTIKELTEKNNTLMDIIQIKKEEMMMNIAKEDEGE